MTRWELATEVEAGFEVRCLIGTNILYAYTMKRLKQKKNQHKKSCKRKKRTNWI